MKRVIAIGLLAGFLLLTSGLSRPDTGAAQACAPAGGSPPALILHDWSGSSPGPTPTFLRQNKTHLETLPFDGIAVYLRSPDGVDNITNAVMTNTPLGYPAMVRVLTPLKGLQFQNLTRNFAAVFSGRPPDFFNDWSTILHNFTDLARAAREFGLKGIYFDNENYFSNWCRYPEGVEYPNLPLKEYQEQARKRGRQIMEAMVAQFPDIVVISLHGPYISEPKAPAPLFPQWQTANQLMGPFFCGFLEGAGKRAVCVDGGKLFHLRTPEEFKDAYDWRKSGIISDRVNSAFIPAPLRLTWPAKSNVAFGINDRPTGKLDMLPEILRPTIAGALRHSDSYAWLCVERFTFLKTPQNGGAGEPWVNAVRQGRADALPKTGHR